MNEAADTPQEPILWEAAPPFASSNSSASRSAAPYDGPGEVVPTLIASDGVATTLAEPDASIPPESGTPAEQPLLLEPQISIIEGPEAPRRVRRPRIRGNPGIVLLTWGPWVIEIGGLAALIVLAVTAPDWGTFATRIGITLLVVGACVGGLIWLFHRLRHRWARRRWPILAASLLLASLLGVGLAPGIHALQGHVLEGQGNYQRAIEEYAASGENSPNGQDIARCYLEWGQRDLRSQDYAMAVQHLEAASETYSATTAARAAREPLGTALLQWGRQLAVEQSYGQAIQQFAHLRIHYAETEAAQQARENQDEPAAYYSWGLQLQASQQFQNALTQFQAIGKLFPSSSYAPQAYTSAASDLYDWGQALIQQARYTQATAVYQQLINQYGNTAVAQQAQQALHAPQPVKGRLIFASGPPDAHVIIRLSSSWSTGPNGYVQGGYVYEAHTDANGFFTFPAVPLGKYLIDWQQGSTFTTLLHQGTYNPVYIADVEPLRGTALGDVQVES